jgi:hypothetical protein
MHSCSVGRWAPFRCGLRTPVFDSFVVVFLLLLLLVFLCASIPVVLLLLRLFLLLLLHVVHVLRIFSSFVTVVVLLPLQGLSHRPRVGALDGSSRGVARRSCGSRDDGRGVGEAYAAARRQP